LTTLKALITDVDETFSEYRELPKEVRDLRNELTELATKFQQHIKDLRKAGAIKDSDEDDFEWFGELKSSSESSGGRKRVEGESVVAKVIEE
jgi:hypothetical protein